MEIRELVLAAQQGNQEAAAEVFRRFENLVQKHVRQGHLYYLGEDARGQANLAVMEAITRYRADLGIPFAAYVESRVKYAVWNLFKRQRRCWQLEVCDGNETAGQQAIAVDVAQMVADSCWQEELQELVAALPSYQAAVMQAVILEGTSLSEIAQKLGMSVQSACNFKKRACRRLKSLLIGM